MTPFELSVRFLLQLAAIVAVCRIVSRVGMRFGQPPVVGEMIAGVLLGPSFLGHFWPSVQGALFPPASRPILFAGAQLGLVLYMFVVGLEFRVDLLRPRLRSAAAISASGILLPFVLGGAIAGVLVRHAGFFPPDVPAHTAIPYLGACLAITAFPMLARIIFEKGLTGTTVGALALVAGALDDAVAWAALALVLAGLTHDPRIAWTAIAGGALFIIILSTLVRPLLRRLARWGAAGGPAERSATAWTLVLLLLAAWCTDAIRLYAVFGAFILGAAFPRGAFAARLQSLIEPLTSILLLPLFFVYSGLNTRIDLVNTPALWLVVLAVLAAAILGKGGACYAAARFCGETHSDALGIGILMNARGLMGLIILNIGLEHGVITPALFSILILMAVVTTLMAAPLFSRCCRPKISV